MWGPHAHCLFRARFAPQPPTVPGAVTARDWCSKQIAKAVHRQISEIDTIDTAKDSRGTKSQLRPEVTSSRAACCDSLQKEQ